MECNIKVKSHFCDIDHKSAVKNFRVVAAREFWET